MQKQQRNAALPAQFDEMRAFLGGFPEQDAVVGDDAHRITAKLSEAGDQRDAVPGLEFVETRSVHQPGDDFPHVVRLAGIGRRDAVDFLRVVNRFLAAPQRQADRFDPVEVGENPPGDVERVRVVFG